MKLIEYNETKIDDNGMISQNGVTVAALRIVDFPDYDILDDIDYVYPYHDAYFLSATKFFSIPSKGEDNIL